jgi:hypothetical protein
LGTIVLGTPTAGTSGGTPVTYTDGYGGDVNTAVDNAVVSANPNISYGASSSINLSGTGSKGLIRFNLSAIPEGATCQSATLFLYKNTGGGSVAQTVSLYPIMAANHDWLEGVGAPAAAVDGDSCWNYLNYDTVAWAGSAGLSTADTDYDSTAIGSFSLNSGDGAGTEYVVELDTDFIETWFGSNNDNHGLLIVSDNNAGSLCSAEHATTGYRPKLVVEYVVEGAGTDELTANDLTLGAPTLGAPALLGEVVEYVNGYGGDVNTAEDFLMSNGWSTRNGGAHPDFQLDPSGGQKAVMRFDLSGLSEDDECVQATLYLYHSYSAEGGNEITATAYSVSAANGDWIEGVGNIAIALEGEPCWNAKEADGEEGVQTAWAGSAGMSTSGTDYEATALGSTQIDPGDDIGTEYQIELTPERIQEWFGATNTNHGIVVFNTNGNGAPHLGSSDHITTGYRPKLVVLYATATTPSDDLTASNLMLGAVILGTPAITQEYALIANTLAVGEPVVGEPIIGQVHSFIVSDLVIGTISLGTATIGQVHNITPNDLLLDIIVLNSPIVGQTHDITANDLTLEAIILESSIFGQLHSLTADNLTLGTITFGSPNLTENLPDTVNLIANNLTLGIFTFGTPIITQTHIVVTNILTSGALVIGEPIIGQIHVLLADDFILGGVALGTSFIGQSHIFTANNIILGTIVFSEPSVGQIHTVENSDLIFSVVTFGQPNIGQTHILGINELLFAKIVFENPTIGQMHVLTTNNITFGAIAVDEPIIKQIHDLLITNIVVDTFIFGMPILSAFAPVEINILTAENLTLDSITFDIPTIEQVHSLIANSLMFSILLGTPKLKDIAIPGYITVNITQLYSIQLITLLLFSTQLQQAQSYTIDLTNISPFTAQVQENHLYTVEVKHE